MGSSEQKYGISINFIDSLTNIQFFASQQNHLFHSRNSHEAYRQPNAMLSLVGHTTTQHLISNTQSRVVCLTVKQ